MGRMPCSPIALDDLVDVDMPPAARLLVDDPHHGGLALQFLNVPRGPVELFGTAGLVVRAGRGSYDLVINHQVDTCFAGEPSPSDQEVEIRTLDLERRRSQRCRSSRPL